MCACIGRLCGWVGGDAGRRQCRTGTWGSCQAKPRAKFEGDPSWVPLPAAALLGPALWGAAPPQVLHRTVGLSLYVGDDLVSSEVETVPQRQFTLQEVDLLARVTGFEVGLLVAEAVCVCVPSGGCLQRRGPRVLC